ncbi:MAG: hypothetical protein K2X47_09620 [Bdellovibrionales bacterium]|nr:hypothetical protein [Bdellovibrionales bacterium]
MIGMFRVGIFAVAMSSAQVVNALPLGNAILAETSSFQKTGSFEEVDQWAASAQKKYPGYFHSLDFGTTPEGRRLRAYVIGEAKKPNPQRPTLLILAGIHAGEIDGKDAGMIFFRDFLAQPKSAARILKKLTIVFVPIFNVDGFARFGLDQRPNQNGPRETGWRVTSQNLNLNRDFMKARAPEMQALLRLVDLWDPLITVDLHVTDGADFQYDVGIVTQPRREDSLLAGAGQALSDAMGADLEKNAFKALPFYPSFKEESPDSGIEDGWTPPRFSQGYFSARNRVGILVETHSWKPYERRVKTMLQVLQTLVHQTSEKGASWASEARKEDQRSGDSTPVILSYETDPETQTFDFAGYEYRRVISPVSGRNETEFNPKVNQVWKVPLQLKIKPELQVKAPQAGYFVAAGQAAFVEEILKSHGLRFQKLKKEILDADLEAFRVGDFQLSPKSFEGLQTVKIQGAWAPEKVDLQPGSLFVPKDQPRLRLVMSLLEPMAPDSLVFWGFFNSFLERREYMEAYVAHQVGLDMLKDPQIKEEFQKRLKAEKSLSEDPEARLDFFYQKHASFDKIWKRIPVFRSARSPEELGKKSAPL